MNSQSRGRLGTACQGITEHAQAAIRFKALLELRSLGRRPKKVGHSSRLNTLRHIADGTNDLEQWHVLIDYRDGNRRLLRKALTVKQAFIRNQFLAGTGKTWARVGE